MQTPFSFKNTRNSSIPLQNNPNFKSSTTWMDQRVLQIMEKYQKPTKRESIHTPQRYEKGKMQNQKPQVWEHLRINTQDTAMTPLREQNFNIDREQPSYYQKQNNRQIPRMSQNNYSDMFYQESVSPTLPKQNYDRFRKQQAYLNLRDDQSKYQKEEKSYVPRKGSYNKPLTSAEKYKCQYPFQQRQHFNCNSSFMDRKSYSPYSIEKKSQQNISKFQFDYPNRNKKSTNRSNTQYYDNYENDKKINHLSDPRSYNYQQTNFAIKNDRAQILYDQRISNIERINEKIKMILNVHDQYQKKSEIKQTKQERYSLTPTKLRIKTDFDELPGKNQTHIQQKRQKSITNLRVTKNEDLNQKRREKSDVSVKKEEQVKASDKKLSEIKVIQEKERPRSCINKKDKIMVNRSDTANEEKYKKIQDQMEKYQNRIAQHTEQKKKMNFNFQPSNPTILKQVSNHKLQNKKNERGFLKNKQQNQTEKINKKCVTENQTKQNKDLNSIILKEERKLAQEPTVQAQACPIDKETNSAQNEQFFRQFSSMIQKNQPQYFNFSSKEGLIESQLYNGLDQTNQINIPHYFNIESQSQVSQLFIESKNFLQTISQQVKLDEQFRLTKTWFVNSDIYNQFEVLQSIIGQRWKQMSLEQIQQQFSVNFEQDDPFYSYRPDQFALEDMVNNYILCSKHWKEQVEHQWNTIKLIEQGLVDKLDLQNKGYIAIEDLVRILNMEEGTFYRNRDLYMIYKRMTGQHSKESNEYLTIDTFNAILCKR